MNLKRDDGAYIDAYLSTRRCIYFTCAPRGTFIKVSDSECDDDTDDVGYGALPTSEHVVLAGLVTRDADDAVALLGRTNADGNFIGEPARVYLGSWRDRPNEHDMRGLITEAIIVNDELRWAVVQLGMDKERDAWVRREEIEAERHAQERKTSQEAYERRQRQCIGATN